MSVPAAPTALFSAAATRRAASKRGAARSSGRSAIVATWARGTTSVWPGNTGRRSKNPRTSVSSRTTEPAALSEAMAQNVQSVIGVEATGAIGYLPMGGILTDPDGDGPMRLRPRPITLLTVAALTTSILTAVSGPAIADDATCFGQAATITGTDGDDVIDLTGTPGQVVVTYAGNDEVIGSAGDDVVCLGDGADRFEGNAGSDSADEIGRASCRERG